MVIACHAVLTTYGAWLPNDPRGSHSKAVYNKELRALRAAAEYIRANPVAAGLPSQNCPFVTPLPSGRVQRSSAQGRRGGRSDRR